MQICYFTKHFCISKIDYLQVSKYRVLLDAREQDSHCVRAVVQEWNTSSVQITGQLMNVCL